jgi:hypothetical protein
MRNVSSCAGEGGSEGKHQFAPLCSPNIHICTCQTPSDAEKETRNKRIRMRCLHDRRRRLPRHAHQLLLESDGGHHRPSLDLILLARCSAAGMRKCMCLAPLKRALSPSKLVYKCLFCLSFVCAWMCCVLCWYGGVECLSTHACMCSMGAVMMSRGKGLHTCLCHTYMTQQGVAGNVAPLLCSVVCVLLTQQLLLLLMLRCFLLSA